MVSVWASAGFLVQGPLLPVKRGHMGRPAAVPTAQTFRLAAHCRLLPKYRYNFRSEVMHRAVVAPLSADVQVSYRAVLALLCC